MAVAGRRPRELGAAVGAGRLGRLPRLLALVPEEVAEGRELPPVAPVLPALRLRPAVHDPDLAPCLLRGRHDHGRHRVHPEVRVWYDRRPAAVSKPVSSFGGATTDSSSSERRRTRSATAGSRPLLAGSRSPAASKAAEGRGL